MGAHLRQRRLQRLLRHLQALPLVQQPLLCVGELPLPSCQLIGFLRSNSKFCTARESSRKQLESQTETNFNLTSTLHA